MQTLLGPQTSLEVLDEETSTVCALLQAPGIVLKLGDKLQAPKQGLEGACVHASLEPSLCDSQAAYRVGQPKQLKTSVVPTAQGFVWIRNC